MAQTREQIIELLDGLGRQPNRALGQHFMIDPALVDRLVAEAGLADNPLVLEVGPGTGALTEALLEAGGEVVAVEIDQHLANFLGARLAPRFPQRFHLISGDALESKHRLNRQMVRELTALSNRREAASGPRPAEKVAEPARVCRLVANLPYNIASPLLAELIGLTWRTRAASGSSRVHETTGTLPSPGANPVAFDRLVFTVQREVADRLAGPPDSKDYGPLSVLSQGLGQVHTLAGKISPNAFYPKPNVFSAMLRIDLPPDRLAAVADLEALHAWLDAGFGHRRKTLAASIRLAPAEWQVRLTTAALAAGVDLSRRGETLTVREYLELARQT